MKIHILDHAPAPAAICYHIDAHSPAGHVALASDGSSLRFLGFTASGDIVEAILKRMFPKAAISMGKDEVIDRALNIMVNDTDSCDQELHIALSGTEFQMSVWRALTDIPSGTVTTYAQVADASGHPCSHRAVANAIGRNPVALFIPCHRVIRSDGSPGGYRWGIEVKKALLALEHQQAPRR